MADLAVSELYLSCLDGPDGDFGVPQLRKVLEYVLQWTPLART